jgi:hypothetical protein
MSRVDICKLLVCTVFGVLLLADTLHGADDSSTTTTVKPMDTTTGSGVPTTMTPAGSNTTGPTVTTVKAATSITKTNAACDSRPAFMVAVGVATLATAYFLLKH